MSARSAPVSAPPLDADPVLLVDWLELVAFFSSRGVARLDEIDNAVAIQEEEHATDDASDDAAKDDRRSVIEEEVERRDKAAGLAYPFELSPDGEELKLKPRDRRLAISLYLTCLVISHFTKSEILAAPPPESEASRVRKKHFQTIATLAVAGHVLGPTVSFGWPRSSEETISEAIARICAMSGTGSPRKPPGEEASKYAKDGGMDVIAWRVADDQQPPPAIMYFGQAASGHNWAGKSSRDELEQFLWAFFDERPKCQTATVTVIPHRISQEEHKRHSARHGHILDRLRTAKTASRGYLQALNCKFPVDGWFSVLSLQRWLYRYRLERLTS